MGDFAMRCGTSFRLPSARFASRFDGTHDGKHGSTYHGIELPPSSGSLGAAFFLYRPPVSCYLRRFVLLAAISVPSLVHEKNGAVGFPLPSRSRRLLVAVVHRIGDDEVVVAHNIRRTRDGEHVVVGG